ncbi:MAG: isochorismatase family protein [Tabrizicola sp.]|nr:isochorismatase family protein [Tabrizicola sp.]
MILNRMRNLQRGRWENELHEHEQEQVYRTAGFGGQVSRGPRPALIVVDFTYGFTDPQYPSAADMTAEIAQTRRLVEAAHAWAIPVIFTAIAYHPAEIEALPWLRKATGMRAMLRESRLAEIDARTGHNPACDPVVVKTGASAFFGTPLAALLTGLRVDTVVVTGATTSGCVRATAVDAVQAGFDVLVPRDCVADRAAAPHDASLYDIAQKYGDLTDAEEVLAYFADLPATRPETRPAPRSPSMTTDER